MPESRFNLLTEPLIEITQPDGERHGATLPDVLARLSRNEAIEYAGLQPHQQHAWHAFLVQLAAIAVDRVGDGSTLPDAPTDWERMLRSLAGGDTAWCLVVEDLAQPAFLQPPVPEGTLDGFKKERIWRPDELDVLVTTRNHDVKSARMQQPRPESWTYVLVSVQTTQGYSGARNYGIARMNGAYSSRPSISVVERLDWPARFRREIGIWLAERPELLSSGYGYPPEDGLALMWLEPWDGTSSLPLSKCDPFFVEVCRRIRLQLDGDQIVARLAPTTAARIDAKDLKGDTGDIWTPVRKKDGACLSVGASGFSYSLMQELLFGDDYRRGAALELQEDGEGHLLVLAQALARGMKPPTDGWHERLIPIPPRVRMLLRRQDEREKLSQLAKRRVERAAAMRRRVLRSALLTLVQGAPDKLDLKDDRASGWLAELDDAIDRMFFEQLWADADSTAEEADSHWDRLLFELAESILERAIGSVPLPSAQRYRVVAVTERVFRGAAYRQRFHPAIDQSSASALPDASHAEENHEPSTTT